MIKRVLAIILCFVCAGLVSCSDVVDVKSNDYGFDDAETGIGYVSCGRAVYAVTVGKVYARDQYGNEYCEIKFESPSRFLCDNNIDLPSVYRAKGEPEITMENFNPVSAFLYLEGEASLWVDQLIAEAKYTGHEDVPDDSEITYAIRDAILLDEPVLDTAPAATEMDTSYTVHIRLLSPDYPGLYYELVFWRDLDGVNYLYDMGTGLSYLCPYIVTYRFWAEA